MRLLRLALLPSQLEGVETPRFLRTFQTRGNRAVVPNALASADVAAASARTMEIVSAVEEIVEAVSAQIIVTPSLVKGEGEVVIRLKPTVLDGSEVKLSAKDNVFSVVIAPATTEVAQIATAAIPQLEKALAEHIPAFGLISVAVTKKGKLDESK